MKKDDKINELQNEIFKLKSELFKIQSKLDKAIKGLEFYASEAAYELVNDYGWATRFALIEEDEYQTKSKEGFEICKAGKFARETLKEIRGEDE